MAMYICEETLHRVELNGSAPHVLKDGLTFFRADLIEGCASEVAPKLGMTTTALVKAEQAERRRSTGLTDDEFQFALETESVRLDLDDYGAAEQQRERRRECKLRLNQLSSNSGAIARAGYGGIAMEINALARLSVEALTGERLEQAERAILAAGGCVGHGVGNSSLYI
jgi:hypothetical protein